LKQPKKRKEGRKGGRKGKISVLMLLYIQVITIVLHVPRECLFLDLAAVNHYTTTKLFSQTATHSRHPGRKETRNALRKGLAKAHLL
jgi:hypothetical protein